MRTFQRSTKMEIEFPVTGAQPKSDSNQNHCNGEFQYQALMQKRHTMIKQAAYFKAEHRGFAPGHELQDWLEAQKKIDDALRPVE